MTTFPRAPLEINPFHRDPIFRYPTSNRTHIWTAPPDIISEPPIEKAIAQYDWPLPRVPVFPISGRTHIQTTTILPTDNHIPPYYDYPLPPQPQYQPPLFDTYNIVLRTVEEAGPVMQEDWPPPRIPIFPLSGRTWIYNTTWQITKPFNQNDWPLPHIALYPISLRTWLNPGLWQISGNVPFNQFDWPLPRILVHPNSARTWISQTQIQLEPVVPPIRQHNWPLPGRPEYPNSGRTWLQSVITGISGNKPHNQTDWPLPRVALQPKSVRTWLDQTRIQLEVVTSPVRQHDWPTPGRSEFPNSARTWLNFGITAISGDKPHNQTSWPLPVPPRVPKSLRTWVNPAFLEAPPPPERPPHPLSWPNPVLRTPYFPLFGVPNLALEPELPLNQYSWPRPIPPRIPNSVRTYVQGFTPAQLTTISLVYQVPIYDWPLPPPRHHPESARFWTNWRGLTPDAIPDAPPAILVPTYDWPVQWDGFSRAGRRYPPYGITQYSSLPPSEIPPTPEPPPEPGVFPDPGYESQVGVWHVHGRRGGRTGKRYRIYPAPGA